MKCPNCKTEGDFAPVEWKTDTRYGKTFNYYRCSGCDVLFHTTHPKNLEEWYVAGEYTKHVSQTTSVVVSSSIIDRVCERVVSQMAWLSGFQWMAKVNSILDVGAQTGQLVKELVDAGFSAKGYDVDKQAARQSFGRVTTNKDVLLERYDLIVCSHVLEHVECPTELLKSLRGDRIYIEVPYFGGWVHKYIFDDNSLQKTAEHAGLSLESQMRTEERFLRAIARPILAT